MPTALQIGYIHTSIVFKNLPPLFLQVGTQGSADCSHPRAQALHQQVQRVYLHIQCQ